LFSYYYCYCNSTTSFSCNGIETAVTCFGGADGNGEITATGGASPYNVSWTGTTSGNPGGNEINSSGGTYDMSGLSTGTYNVTVTDNNNCTATTTVNIADGVIISANFTAPTNQCLTGNSFTFSGATSTISSGSITSYNWNFGSGATPATGTGATPPAVTYSNVGSSTITLTVSNGTCSDVTTASITIYDIPAPTGITSPVLCNGGSTGSATVSTPITPGPGPFSYAWDAAAANQITNPASNLAAGSYTVTVTDQTTNCTGQVTLVVTEPLVLSATAVNTAPKCAGGATGTATATGVDGTAGYTYSWNTTPVQTTNPAINLIAGSYTATVTDANGCSTTVSTTLIDPPGIVLNSSMTQANCGQPDGSATVNIVSGGSGNFSYSWDSSPVQNTQTATAIPAGTYIATVTDLINNCVALETVVVTSTTGIIATATLINDALCNDSINGQASAAPTGGNGPYTYAWNTTPVQIGSTVIAGAGTYTVVITDANGCTGNDMVTIGEPTPVVASIPSSTSASCFGANDGTATAAAAGGTAGYTYSWNTTPVQTTITATGLAPGNYIVTVSDLNSCSDTISINITDGPQMTSTITGTNVSCFGGGNGTIDLTPNGGTSPYTYVWSNASTSEDPAGLSAGTYFVKVTSQEGCSVNDTIDITEPTQLIAAIDSVKDVLCNGDANGVAFGSASGGTVAYSYSWSINPAQSTATATSLGVGIYTLTVTDNLGCTATASATISEPSPVAATAGSIDAYCGVDQGAVWVNPTTGVAPFTLVWDSAAVSIGTTDTVNYLFPGNYGLLIQDVNGCKLTTSVAVNAAPGGTASISNSTDVSCFGGSDGDATISTGGAFPGFTYLWDAAAGNQTTNPATGLSVGTYNVAVTDTFGCVMNTSVTITEPVALSIIVASVSKICPDSCNAVISSTTSGGTSPFNYLWNDPSSQITPTATGLCSNSYKLIVTDDNGCTAADSLNVVNQPVMVIANTVVPASCNQADGEATAAVAANGTSPYSFEWSDGTVVVGSNDTLPTVIAGTYFVTVTDSLGCSVSDTATIPNLSGPSIAVDSIYNVLCSGGNNGYAEVQVTGGAFPYTYLWNDPTAQTTPSGSNLIAGSYVVTATDTNGCTVSTSVTISEPTLITLTAGGTDPSCFGYNDGSTWVNANGGIMPYTYTWNDPLSQTNDTTNTLITGIYTVTVVDSNNCFDTISVVLVDPLLFSVNVTGNNVQCFNACDGNAIATLTNGISPFTYVWDDPSTQTTDSIFGLCNSTTNVVVTDDMGCIANGNITLTQPNLLVVTEDTLKNVSCNAGNDGYSSVTIAGGTGPYTYTWDLSGSIVSTSQTGSNLLAGSYLETVIDAKGCTDNITIVITEPNVLTANATPTDAACFGSNSGMAVVTPAGGTTPYAYQWTDVALQQTDTAFTLIAGNYDVTVTDSLGCTTAVTNIIVNEPQQLTLATSTHSSTCGNNNGDANVVVGGGSTPYSFQWNDPSTQATATASSLLAGSYTVYVTDNNGCIDSTTANIIDLGSPSVSIPTTTDVSCAGASDGSATSVATGGTTPYTYSWNTTPVQTSVTAINLEGLTYSVTVTDFNGCTASATATIIENSGLSAAITTSNDVTCNGFTDGDATVIGAGGGAPYIYLWDDALGQTTPLASTLGAGTYVVTISDTNACTAKDTIIITEPTILTVTLDSISDVRCNAGNDGYVNVITSGGTLGYTYVWTPNISSGATASGLIAGNYSLQITDGNGCIVNDNYVIAEPDQLVIDTSSTPSTCGQPNGTASVTITTASTPNYTYAWNDPSNQTTATATATNLNASLYTVTVTDANGCFVIINANVESQTGPIIDSLIVTAVSCNGGSDGTAKVYASGNDPFTYSWDDPFAQISQTATGLSASPPLYTVIVTDVNGCTSTSVAQISEPAILNVFINAPDTICFGEAIQLFANGNGGTLPYNYLWGSGQNGQGPILDTPATSTTYTVDILDGSPSGCQASATKTVIVRVPLSINSADASICQGDLAELTATSTGGNPSNTNQYFWMAIDSLTGGLTPTGVANPVNPIQLSPGSTTDYIVWVEDACSVPDTVGVTINVNDTATAIIIPVVDACFGVSQEFALITDIGVVFDWDFNSDGIVDVSTGDTSLTYTYPATGTFDVTVTIETLQGCISTIVSPLLATVHPNPIADFTTLPNPPIVTLIDPVFEFTDLSVNATSWLWEFGDSTLNNTQNPFHTYADTGYYVVTLHVASAFGCTDSISKTVQVKPDFFFAIPNTFTPEGDGLNDVFRPGALLGAVEDNYSFLIFDRWGELIFEGHDLSDGWDGTVKGGKLIVQSGTYVWTINVTDTEGTSHKYTGHVNVIK